MNSTIPIPAKRIAWFVFNMLTGARAPHADPAIGCACCRLTFPPDLIGGGSTWGRPLCLNCFADQDGRGRGITGEFVIRPNDWRAQVQRLRWPHGPRGLEEWGAASIWVDAWHAHNRPPIRFPRGRFCRRQEEKNF